MREWQIWVIFAAAAALSLVLIVFGDSEARWAVAFGWFVLFPVSFLIAHSRR